MPGYSCPTRRSASTHAALVERAAALGVRVAQICDNLPIDDLLPAEIDRLAALAAARGVSIEVGTRGIGPEHLARHIALAARLGSPILRVVIDTAQHHPTPEEIVSTLRGALPALGEAGVVLAIENHDRFRADVLRGIVEAVGATARHLPELLGASRPDIVVGALGIGVNLHVKDFAVCGFYGWVRRRGAPGKQGMLDVPRPRGAAPRAHPNAILGSGRRLSRTWRRVSRRRPPGRRRASATCTLIPTDARRAQPEAHVIPERPVRWPRGAPPRPRAAAGGPLSSSTSRATALLRLGEREVLRRVHVAVRDRNWGTIPATLSAYDLRRRTFEITFDARHWEGEIDFAWRGRIVGTPEGAITYTMAGEALTGFLKNRIGLCVLHPMEAAGAPCTVEHVDGGVEEGAFPRLIAPHQPFLGIRAIRHRVAEGVWATVRLEGDTFEMEDQRNWTDASFKTYSTPLALPIPVRIDAGTRVEQSLHLTIAGAPKRAAAAPDRRSP